MGKSQRDFTARNQMWSADFAPLERAIRQGIERFERGAPMPPITLEPDGPTPRNFFRQNGENAISPTFESAAHRAALIAATERRLSIHLPALAHDLFVQCNGGGTDFLYWPQHLTRPIALNSRTAQIGGHFPKIGPMSCRVKCSPRSSIGSVWK